MLVTPQREKEREIITFKDNRSNFARKQTGERIGEHLIVGLVDRGKYYAIFGMNGKLFVQCSFKDYDACLSVAELINELFDPYMPILASYPNADVISLAKWSVERGLQVYEFTELLDEQWRLTGDNVNELWIKAQQNAKKWGYEHIK